MSVWTIWGIWPIWSNTSKVWFMILNSPSFTGNHTSIFFSKVYARKYSVYFSFDIFFSRYIAPNLRSRQTGTYTTKTNQAIGMDWLFLLLMKRIENRRGYTLFSEWITFEISGNLNYTYFKINRNQDKRVFMFVFSN